MKEIKNQMKFTVKGETVTIGIPDLGDIQQLLADYPTNRKNAEGIQETVDYENGEKSLSLKGWAKAMRNDFEHILESVWPKEDNKMTLSEFMDIISEDDMFAIWLIYGDTQNKQDGLLTRARRSTFRIIS